MPKNLRACISVGPTSINKHCGLLVIIVSNCECQFVNQVKYLGVMIHSSTKTTIDVTRQTRKFYIDSYESKPANSNFSNFLLFDKFEGNTFLHNVLKNLVPSMSLYPSFRQLSKPAISHRDTFQRNKTGYKPSFCNDNIKRH